MVMYLGGQKISPIIKVGAEINNQDKTITENGTYTADTGYTGLGEVTVNVSGGSGGITDLTGIGYTVNSDNSVTFDANYVVKGDNTIALITNSDGTSVLPLFEDNADTALMCAWQSPGDLSNIVKVNLTALNEVSGDRALEYTFMQNPTITSVDLSNLTTVSGRGGMSNAFKKCGNLTSVDLSSLTTISGYSGMSGIFSDCTSLTSIDLPNLTTISGESGLAYAFGGGTAINSITFPSLSVLTGKYAFRRSFARNISMNNGTIYFPALTSTSFGSYTDQFNNMLQSVTGCTVHFPSNLQSVIGSWYDAIGCFGGINTTVLFDLPATT